MNYTYDTLNRLATAQATDGSWGNAYSYDGFGNLTAKTVTAGSAPSFSGWNPGYDLNGNALTGPRDPANLNLIQYTYDVENRIVGAVSNGGSPTAYGYDPQGKRILVQTSAPAPTPPGGTITTSTFTFYGVTGQRLTTFVLTTATYQNSGPCNGATACTSGPFSGYIYFGGRLITGPNGPTVTDRLGSQRAGLYYPQGTMTTYYPWGEEKTSTPDGQVKFATYFRDIPGQDYADQRYYNSNAGRFYTPDPSTGVDPKNPITWNKYVYAGDDPVNFNDRHGLMMDLVDEGGGGGFSDYWGFGADIGGLDNGGDFTGIGDKPGGGGSGATQIVPRGPFGRLSYADELSALTAGKSALAAHGAFSQDCERGVARLGSTVTPEALAQAAGSVQIANGTEASKLSIAEAYGNAAVGAAAQFHYDQQYASYLGNYGLDHLTVGELFTWSPGLSAWTPFAGNTVYIDAYYFTDNSLNYSQALLMHEMLHNAFGLDDGDIQQAFFGRRGGPTQDITLWFLDNCIR